MPKLLTVTPDVILPYQQTNLLIQGEFTPLTVSYILINGQFRLSPVFTKNIGEIIVQAPVLNPSDYLRIQIETKFGDLTNSLFVKYVKHI